MVLQRPLILEEENLAEGTVLERLRHGSDAWSTKTDAQAGAS